MKIIVIFTWQCYCEILKNVTYIIALNRIVFVLSPGLGDIDLPMGIAHGDGEPPCKYCGIA
jgi:hypothetical protein